MKKSLRYSMVAALLSVSFSGFAADNHGAHWSYHGKTGPAHWADLDEKNSACKLSKEQSPINIETAKVEKADLPKLEISYVGGTSEVVNNGHTIQVNTATGGSLKTGNDAYKLLQFHFHTPSEEKINGKAWPLVAHLVHKSEAGQLSVIGVLFKVGKKNEALQAVFDALPAKEGETKKLENLNPQDFLPANKTYFGFMGSLTTPPCSDGVRWQVLQDPVELSFAQLRAFRKLYKMNARPVQPVNERKVQVSM